MKRAYRGSQGSDEAGGFAIVDEKGRFSLPKPVRARLGLDPGAAVAWVATSGALVIIPQDPHLAELSARAHDLLAAAGVSVDDLVATLPDVRAGVVEETYGADFVAELARAERSLEPDDAAADADRRR